MTQIYKNVSFYIRIIKESAIQNYNYVIKICNSKYIIYDINLQNCIFLY